MTSESKTAAASADASRPLSGISAIVVEDNWSIASGCATCSQAQAAT